MPTTPLRALLQLAALTGACATAAFAAYTPPGPALATGKAKFLGSAHSNSQSKDFIAYWNQVTPENGGKWGAVEAQRDVMTWGDLDAAYRLAKDNGLPFKMHTMIWGAQQPAWIETLPAAEQLQEIEEWFAAVAARYPDLEMIDLVNEPINDPPTRAGDGGGNYANALGGAGTTGYDWVIKAFQLGRQYFPRAKLLVNEYSITNETTRAQTYVRIINLLKERSLIDGIGIQAHAFSTTVPAATTKSNLDLIAATGLPIYVSELDIDGPTDQEQVDNYKRIFTVFWEHASVRGITLWGYRPGLWRNTQKAYLVLDDGTERPALVWLKEYIAASPAGGPPIWMQPQAQSVTAGAAVTFSVDATGATGYQWLKDGTPIAGATSATFTLPAAQLVDAGNYQVQVTGPGGTTTSSVAPLAVGVPGATRLFNISTRSFVGKDADKMIAGFIIPARKTVLIRAWGPTLGKLGVSGTLADPVLDLFQDPSKPAIATNENWSDSAVNKAAILQAREATGAYAFADGSLDAEMVITLEPGAYTAQVSGKNGGTGNALVEVFEVERTGTQLYNVSTRSVVQTGASVQIAGFIILGQGTKKVLIRAGGPGLGKLGVPGTLADPVVEVRRLLPNNGNELVAENDNWNASLVPEFQKRGVDYWNVGSLDAALVLDLPPGSYTATVYGKNNTTGVALVEVFDTD